MFFKLADTEGEIGYVNLSLVEFVRIDLNGSVTLYFINGKPMKLEPKNSKDILDYLKTMKLNNII